MSDYQDNYFRSSQKSITTKLSIWLFSTQRHLADSVASLLDGDRYELECLSIIRDFKQSILENYEQIDCLILAAGDSYDSLVDWLCQSTILLPTIIIKLEQTSNKSLNTQSSTISVTDLTRTIICHQAELHLYPTQLIELDLYISLAIGKFINLTPNLPASSNALEERTKAEREEFLIAQQRRLTKKIKAKFGLGVPSKRNSHNFYLNLASQKQEKIYQKLSYSYRQIVINYFNNDSKIDKSIDEFVDLAFFADISTSQILEIHMELIDDFSQQLKIEGRSNDILLDYRLPLIDVISHLCEIYRRSVSDKDFYLELLFAVE